MASHPTVQEKDGDCIGPKFCLVHGVRMAEWSVDPNFGKDLAEFQTRKDDVFVVSYPKSGKCKVFFQYKIILPKIEINNVRRNNEILV